MRMRRPRGYLLVMTLVVTATLIFLASVLIQHARAEGTMATRSEHDLVAEEAARAGISAALNELAQNAGWTAGFASESLSHSDATYAMTFGSGSTPYSTHNGTGAGAVTGYRGRSVPAGMVHLVSVGTYGRASSVQEALVAAASGPFTHALFGARTLDMSARVEVDSYNSAVAPYDPENPGTNGDVGVNVGDSDAIRMSNVDIQGTVYVAPGGSEATSIRATGQPEYDGFQVMSAPMAMADTSPPTGTSSGDVSVSGSQTVELPPGTLSNLTLGSHAVVKLSPGDYVVTGDLDMGSGASLQVDAGVVNLYVLGEVKLRGQGEFDNDTGSPANFRLYGGTEEQSWDLRGLSTTQMSFVLYAPQASVEFGGGIEIYGSFVAGQIGFDGNARVHYDEALAEVDGGGVQVTSRW